MQNPDTKDVRYVSLMVKADLYSLIKKAAHKREMSLADFVRTTLKEAAEFYVES